MNQKPQGNVASSIRAQLLRLSKQLGEDFNLLLTRYALDRLLYRLSQSEYRNRFIIKGATLFRVWQGEPHRATKDLDLLGYGVNEISELIELFKAVCQQQCLADGMEFQAETITGEKIKSQQEYEGVRLKIAGMLGTARINTQIDIGFGDAVTPAPPEVEFPTILDLPAPRLRIYPRETVVAEKFQAMVSLGIINSRVKDFYDLWFLSQNFEFQGRKLVQAIKATFERRQTAMPSTVPFALTPEFASDAAKQQQWKGFLNKGRLKSEPQSLSEVIAALKDFLMPPTLAAQQEQAFEQLWVPLEGWRPCSHYLGNT